MQEYRHVDKDCISKQLHSLQAKLQQMKKLQNPLHFHVESLSNICMQHMMVFAVMEV